MIFASPIFLAFVAPPNTCGTPTCPVPHCAKCGGGAHGTPQFCLQCCPGFTPVAMPPYTYCTGSPAIYWQSSPPVANSTLLVAYLGAVTKGTGMVNDVVDKYNLAYDKHSRRRGIF